MSELTQEQKNQEQKNEELLEQFNCARQLFWLQGMITHAERERITKRIIKWGKSVGLDIQRKPGFVRIKKVRE